MVNNEINNQILFLKSKWFIIKDEKNIRLYLINIWLYKLSKYFKSFKDYNWVDFNEVINLYLFDRSLRNLNFWLLEVIENNLKNLFLIYFKDKYKESYLYNEKYSNNRLLFIKEKTKALKEKHKKINPEIFISKLTFWEIVKLYKDLKPKNKEKILKHFNIPLKVFDNWISCLNYLRNLSSHWENIFNRNMTKTLKVKEVILKFWEWSNNKFISYFYVLSILKNILIPEYKYEKKVFHKIKQFNINLKMFWIKKETFPSQLESEAWKVLVQELYSKHNIKSNNFSKKSSFSIILATDDKLWIWRNNNLAWSIKEDMKYFRDITSITSDKSKKNALIMGRKTWESIPEKFRPLPGRINCILTRKITKIEENNSIFYFNSINKCLEKLSKNKNIENIFVIWWANLYNQVLDNPKLDKIYITKIKWNHNCDVFFDWIPESFILESTSEEKEENDIKFKFEVYKKRVE